MLSEQKQVDELTDEELQTELAQAKTSLSEAKKIYDELRRRVENLKTEDSFRAVRKLSRRARISAK